MSDGQIEQIPFDQGRRHGLGRHVRHDFRNRLHAAPMGSIPTKTKKHRIYGTRLYQNGIGACTGFTAAAALNSEPIRDITFLLTNVWRSTFKNEDGFNFYRRATMLDPWEGSWEPDDTGSSGLAVAKAVQQAGLITSYQWGFGLQHGLRGINSKPWLVGSYWTYDMDTPDADGRVRPTGDDAGGHEYLWRGVEIRSKINLGSNRSWFVNSWGNWGPLNGEFYMTWNDFEGLLERDGDLVTFS